MALTGKRTGLAKQGLQATISDYDRMIERAEKADEPDSGWIADMKATRAELQSDLDEVESGEGVEAEPAEPMQNDQTGRDLRREERNNPAEQIGDGIAAVEEATVETVEAAAEAGRPDLAAEVAARVVAELRGANAHVEDAAEAVEEVAEEIAAEAPPESEVAEAAEDAVEAAHDAQELVEVAEAEIREEERDQGGGDAVTEEAARQAVHESASEAAEAAPVAEAPAIEAEGEVIAEVAAEPLDPSPAPIKPQSDHPYFKRRKIRVFGKELEL